MNLENEKPVKEPSLSSSIERYGTSQSFGGGVGTQRITKGREPTELQEAVTFVNKIKKRFENDVQVYQSFLDILKKYRRGHTDVKEAYPEVAALFTHHPDLLAEFNRYMPKNFAVSSERTDEIDDAINKLILCRI